MKIGTPIAFLAIVLTLALPAIGEEIIHITPADFEDGMGFTLTASADFVTLDCRGSEFAGSEDRGLVCTNPFNDENDPDTGIVYLCQGFRDPTPVEYDLDEQCTKIYGVHQNESLTTFVIGNFLGDDTEDLVMSAARATVEIRSGEPVREAGIVYVFDGSLIDNILYLDEAHLTVKGVYSSGQFGASLATVPIQGGYDKLLVGHPGSQGSEWRFGSVYLLHNQEEYADTSFFIDGVGGEVLTHIVNKEEEDLHGRLGEYVASGGDHNCDGIQDHLLVDRQNNGDSGAVYLVFGSNKRPDLLEIADLNGTNGFVMYSGLGLDHDGVGMIAEFFQDLDGDNCDEVFIGYPSAGEVGVAALVYGTDAVPDSPRLEIDDLYKSNAGGVWFGHDPTDGFGSSGATGFFYGENEVAFVVGSNGTMSQNGVPNAGRVSASTVGITTEGTSVIFESDVPDGAFSIVRNLGDIACGPGDDLLIRSLEAFSDVGEAYVLCDRSD